MTNQNVLTPDKKPSLESLDMLIAAAMSTPELQAVFRGLGGVPQRPNYGGGKEGAKANAWIDSMRASSPTRTKSANFSENKEQNSWILQHPSALDMFDQMINNSKGKKIVVFLDYDGTLSPIVADPDKAFMTKKMRATVKGVARHFPTAIVSGRSRDKVYNFVRLAELYYAGSHGMDIMGPAKHLNKGNQAIPFQPARLFLPMIDEVYKILVEKTKSVPGANVENNKFCLSVHFRCVDEKNWGALAEQVKLVLDKYPELKLTEGRKVLEIRPTIKWDKGKALEFLLQSLGFANSKDVFPIYIGDDRTDEDAFKVLSRRGQGTGILVSTVPKQTDAFYTLQDPSEVQQFLRRLVEWKRSQTTVKMNGRL